MKKIVTENQLTSFIRDAVKRTLAEARGFDKLSPENAFDSAFAGHEGSEESPAGEVAPAATSDDDSDFDADWDKSFVNEDTYSEEPYAGGHWDEMAEVFTMAVEHSLETSAEAVGEDFVGSYGEDGIWPARFEDIPATAKEVVERILQDSTIKELLETLVVNTLKKAMS